MPTVIHTNSDATQPDTREPEAGPKKVRPRKRRVAIMCGILLFLLFIMGGFLSNFIPSSSMEPNLYPGDHILTIRSWLAYPLHGTPNRGDIIVFRLPLSKFGYDGQEGNYHGNENAAAAQAPKEEDTILIKRVIGLPGDTVQLRGNVLFVNGQPLKEDYRVRLAIDPESQGYKYAFDEPLKVPPGELFVLGDNRNSSDDGRFWGTLKREDVIGKFVRILYNEGKHGLNEERAEADKQGN